MILNSPSGKDILFIHIRKNAGHSIGKFFRKLGLVKEELWRTTAAASDESVTLKTPLSDGLLKPVDPSTQGMRKLELFLAIKKYTSFAIVRNPYERVLSCWKYCKSTKNRDLKDCLKNPPKKGHDHRHFTLKQTDFIAYDKQIIVDYVLRIETLQSDLEKMCNSIGIDLKGAKIPHIHKQKYKAITEGLTPSGKQKIYEAYKEDFELLGYEK